MPHTAHLGTLNIFNAPPAEEGMEPEHGNSLDVSRLSFPAQLVITLVTTAVTIAGSVWITAGGLKSDVRDIVTRMEAQRELESERAASVRESLDSLKRRQELQQYEIQSLKEAILKLQNGRK